MTDDDSTTDGPPDDEIPTDNDNPDDDGPPTDGDDDSASGGRFGTRQRVLAAVAALAVFLCRDEAKAMLEAAGADNEFAPEECEHVIATLKSRFELAQTDAEELIQYSQTRRAESSDLWKFTNIINQTCSNDEKMDILREVWRVIYADGTLDGHEDYLIHKLAKLLNLNHPKLIEAKMAVLREIRG